MRLERRLIENSRKMRFAYRTFYIERTYITL